MGLAVTGDASLSEAVCEVCEVAFAINILWICHLIKY